ncbi:MAG: TlpA family protein disulfide reductase [Fusobacteriaceae bacterium]|nr:TlpA family protein disulfide reductase [Fusobacteriaceae bacterium]MBN2838254.1 TlpA family protein disulfide reductase [Fusobacteriaceae bacterium]
MKKFILILSALFLISTLSYSTTVKAKVGIQKGNEAPNIKITDLNGKTVNLKDYRGKTVLLNFWATWCPPCRAEMPYLEEVWVKNKKDITILAVSIDEDSTANVKKFIKDGKYTFPVFHDKKGDTVSTYLIKNIPTTYIINKDGIIIDKIVGGIDWTKYKFPKVGK